MAYEPGDLAIKIDSYKLNIRAAGVIIHNGKILLHKGETANHYALLGGHVRIGENSQDTVKREIQEELGKEIEITGYISTIENFFELKGIKYHEIMFVYKAEFCNEEDKKIEYTMKNMEGRIESDIHYEWIEIDELEKYPLKPQKIINVIKNGVICILKFFYKYILTSLRNDVKIMIREMKKIIKFQERMNKNGI